LAFIGVKMLIEFFDIHISIYVSLGVIVICLAGSIFYSMHATRKEVPKEVGDDPKDLQ
jgi:tellurite resistance protein TerC